PLGARHVKTPGGEQEVDLRVDVEEGRGHARFLRVRSISAARSLLYSTRWGSVTSRLRSAGESFCKDSRARTCAAFTSGRSSTRFPPRITGRSRASDPEQHSPERPSTSRSGNRKSCLAPGSVALSS